MTMEVAPLRYFTEEQAAKMSGISRPRLRAWCRAGIIARAPDAQGFTFQDLVALRSAKAMVEQGISVSSIRQGIDRLKVDAPGEIPAHCLARHRVLTQGEGWSVRRQGLTENVHSGQLSFDYDTQASQNDDARVLSLPRERCAGYRAPRGPVAPDDHDDADAWFDYGSDCELLWDKESPTDVYYRRAKQAYLKAVEQDESHARAWSNLATLHACVGDLAVARAYYEMAIARDDTLVEPLCNLGELDLREGAFQDAADRFGSILVFEPENLDALYGLARAVIAQDEHEWGADILRIYCRCLSRLDPCEIDEELEERWEGARLVLSTHEHGYTQAKPSHQRPGLEHA